MPRKEVRKNRKTYRGIKGLFGKTGSTAPLKPLETNFSGTGKKLGDDALQNAKNFVNHQLDEADEKATVLDSRNSKSPIEDLQRVWGEMNEQERNQLLTVSANQSEELAKLFRLPELSEDNKKRFTKLLYEMVHLYGGDISDLMVGWVHDNKNYTDFFLSKDAIGEDYEEFSFVEVSDSEPSLESIEVLSTAIKAYILSRLTHRKNTGGNYSHILIRVTVDDGTERKSQWI